MLALLAPLLSGVFGSAFSAVLDGYKARLAAMNSTDQMATNLAIKEIEAEIESRKNANAIILAESGRWWTAAPRALVQWSCALFVVKCIIWDKMLGWGTTDGLTGQVGDAFTAVMMMWFGGRTIEKVAQIFGKR